jgi:hypothetical protein
MKTRILSLAAVVTLFAACGAGGKDKDKDKDEWPWQGARVHVAGDVDQRATLWEGGAARRVGDGGMSWAMSVFASGPDVYVAGFEGWYGASYDRATLWTNGSAKRLSDGPSQAYSVHVSGGNVYVAGIEYEGGGQRATLWTNGSAQRLGGGQSAAYSVAVSPGGDVYVAGIEYVGSRHYATLWKNGAAERLASGPPDSPDASSVARSVCVSGDDVYVAGTGTISGADPADPYDRYHVWRATLWENGVPRRLSEDEDGSVAYSVFASGGDVRVAGAKYGPGPYVGPTPRATLWENGAPRRLSDGYSYAQSVFVLGADVYAAGYVHNEYASNCATLWANGSALRLCDDHSSAYSVFVK